MAGDAGMASSRTGTSAALALIAAAIWVAAGNSAAAQTPERNEAKIQRCRENAIDLYWLNREQLRARCGLWSSTYTVKTPEGEVERLVYSRYFVVTMRNGQVSTIRQRRQIFTGFKKQQP
jgi:hypothetical protein